VGVHVDEARRQDETGCRPRHALDPCDPLALDLDVGDVARSARPVDDRRAREPDHLSTVARPDLAIS
jgi:hypothetical protein